MDTNVYVDKRYLWFFDKPPPYLSYFLSRRSSPAPKDKAIVIVFTKESFVTPAKCEQDRREGKTVFFFSLMNFSRG